MNWECKIKLVCFPSWPIVCFSCSSLTYKWHPFGSPTRLQREAYCFPEFSSWRSSPVHGIFRPCCSVSLWENTCIKAEPACSFLSRPDHPPTPECLCSVCANQGSRSAANPFLQSWFAAKLWCARTIVCPVWTSYQNWAWTEPVFWGTYF